jgi:SulP family sulfate permease
MKEDIPAGLVVFLVATPLCLGIAQASGAPLLSGLVAGMVGGLVVSALSRSPLSVSGPAAGLAVIVATSIADLGFRPFLMAVVLAGALQMAIGALRLGVIAHFFPNAVIKGMLAAIGILIVLKQLPHAIGYDVDFQGDESFVQADGHNTFSTIRDAFGAVTPAAVVITVACALAYLIWPKVQRGILKQVPTPLVAVVIGGVLAAVLPLVWTGGVLSPEHLVALPIFSSVSDVQAAIVLPDFASITNPKVITTAITLCIVASIETLLSIEAVDRLDPRRRISPPNRELLAQGVGNMVSGFIGGLPITSVIVRSSANVQAGGRTRLSAMVHGVLLLIGVVALPAVLNQVPLAALAVVLIVVGTKLASPQLFRSMWQLGITQFIPFAVTIVAVVFTDLLRGTLIGLVVGIVFAIRRQQKNAIVVVKDGGNIFIRFTKDMTFLQKARIKDVLLQVEDGQKVVIDRERVDFVDDDVEEVLAEFAASAPGRGITVEENLGPAEQGRRQKLGGTGH